MTDVALVTMRQAPALAASARGPASARVDMVRVDTGALRLMELELSAPAFAAALRPLLVRGTSPGARST